MIEATNLANYYGGQAAVDDSSFSVEPVVGEVLGFDGVDEIADRSSSGFELGNGTPRPRVVRAAVAAGADGLMKVPGVTPRLVLPAPNWAPRRPVSSPRSATVRVTYVTDFYLPRLGGIERHVCDLARAQWELGFAVDVITGGGRAERQRSTARRREPLGWHVRELVAVSDSRCATCGARGVVRCRPRPRRDRHAARLLGRIGGEPPRCPDGCGVALDARRVEAQFGAAADLVGRSRWPLEWIAAHLGCRPGTVKSRHARARAKIRTGLS